MTDTRKDKRAPISLKVRFKSATVDEFIEQYAKDISKGGIFIKSNKNSPPMPIGTLLKFEFQLKDESKLIQGVGRVVWKRELEGSSENDPAGMGIKFIKMDPESKGLVDQIVAGRGEAPGQFEAGGGSVKDEEPAAATTTAPSTTASAEGRARPVRSQKATMQFFPSTTPQNELPKPEDRTQVRHASEFLASALSSAGVDEATTGEAEKKAEEARKRSEEIEREREEQQRKAREEEDKKARAEKERQEREKAEAEEKEKAAAAAKEKAAAAAAAPAKTASEPPPKKKTSERPPADKPAAAAKPASDDKKAAAASATPAKKAEPKAAAAIAPPPPAEPGSNMMVIFAGVLVVVALGAYFMFTHDSGPTDTDLPPPPPTTVAEVPPPTTTVEDTVPPDVIAEDGTGDVVDDGAGTPPETTVEEPPPPAVTHDLRVDSTPTGATIVVDGEERGVAPQTLSLGEGEHSVEARLAGYHTATQTVTSAAGARPVRIALTALPYVIHVTTTPPGARVRVGGRTVTAPGDATVARPTAPIVATATLAGYLDGTGRVEVSGFTQGEDAMSADLSITLAPRPAAPPPTTRTARPPTTGTTTAPPPETTTAPPETTTAPPPATEAPPPATEAHHDAPPPATETHHETTPPPATEAPPDNPF